MLGISREYIYLLTPRDTTHGFSQFQLKTHMRASLSMDLSSCRYFSFAGCVYQFFSFNNKKKLYSQLSPCGRFAIADSPVAVLLAENLLQPIRSST